MVEIFLEKRFGILWDVGEMGYNGFYIWIVVGI